jgi:hypothetical protein
MINRRVLHHYRIFVSILLLCMAAPVAANYIDEMQTAYMSGDSESVYAMAQQHIFEGEGDPRFDLYYGLAAIDSGSTSEGVFALERVLTLQPDNHQARLGLVRGYSDLGQNGRSRKELDTLLAGNPPEQIRQQAEQYQQRVGESSASGRAWGGFYAEYGIGHDDNINSGASDRRVFVPLIGVTTTLRDEAVERDGGYQNAAVGVYGVAPLNSSFSLFGSLDAYRRDNMGSSRHDILETSFEGGVAFTSGVNEFRLAALWQDYQLGHDPYRKMVGGRVEWRRSLADGARVTLFVERDRLDYDSDARALDSRLTIGGVGWLQPLSSDGRSIFFATLYGGNEKEREDPPASPLFGQSVPDRDLYGLKLGTELAASSDCSVDVTLQAIQSDYNEQDPMFLRKREDDYYSLAVGANWYFHPQWSLRGEVSYADNDSNIDIYSYDRTAVGVTLRFDY